MSNNKNIIKNKTIKMRMLNKMNSRNLKCQNQVNFQANSNIQMDTHSKVMIRGKVLDMYIYHLSKPINIKFKRISSKVCFYSLF